MTRSPRSDLTKHHDKPTVAAYNRNHDSKPIDGIFATWGIKITAGGYSAFDEAIQSPHRALWVDINLGSVFGTKLAPTEKAAARRIKTKDPLWEYPLLANDGYD
jgi:hypothetical protein